MITLNFRVIIPVRFWHILLLVEPENFIFKTRHHLGTIRVQTSAESATQRRMILCPQRLRTVQLKASRRGLWVDEEKFVNVIQV